MAKKAKPKVVNDALSLYRGSRKRQRKAAALKLGRMKDQADQAVKEVEAEKKANAKKKAAEATVKEGADDGENKE